MSRLIWHVTPTGDGDWKVKRTGASRADSVHDNKAEAVERIRELGASNMPAQAVIHDRYGKIQTEHTYGQDPRWYKG